MSYPKNDVRPAVLTIIIAQLLGIESLHFTQLPEIVNRFLMAPDPIMLHYMINPATVPPERHTAWDVEVKLEDLSLKHRMKNVTLDANQATLKTLGDIDDEVRSIRKIFPISPQGFLHIADRSAHSVVTQFSQQIDVPPLVCARAGGVHSDVVGISV